tara:strand:- start:786 stop:1217 length:432 start_codon:yes stop_codon:yes gene_type:complete
MVFLYVGLGVAMISGISAMLQIGNNVNNLMFLSTFKQNDYYQTSLPSYDRRIMEILNNYSGPISEVCANVKSNINDTFYEDGEIFLSTGNQTPSTNSLFDNSCVLVNTELKHRVIINKNEFAKYNLFSCYLKNNSFCTYEVNK